jgi:hypothetical protein
MNQEFVPYEEAIALKELGFDEPCFGFYDDQHNKDNLLYLNDSFNKDGRFIYTKAPTYSQAFRWLRDTCKLDSIIVPSGDSSGKTNGYFYEVIFDFSKENFESETYRTYEQAELGCLIELINILKNK